MRGLAKSFYLAVFSFIIVFLYATLKEIKNTQLDSRNLVTIVEKLDQDTKKSENDVVNNKELKYILQWTNPRNVPFVYMGVGQEGFIKRNCQYTNCFVTSDKNYLGDVSKFDVIAFAGTEMGASNNAKLPQKRSPHQKYAFTNIESAGNYPICTDMFDNFFNWTWTYRLDSDTKWGYIIVRDADGNIIGPKTDMHWMKLEDMNPVSEEVAAQLRNKTKAAAWFVSNCKSQSGRERYVRELQKALEPYDLKVDIYGTCGPHKCDRSNEEQCFQIIKTDYYFYLSFENSFSEDYVTEKLLHGLKYSAIPIVYGGANYTR
jgi:alpha-1,3-fucosyltransferase